MSTKTSPSPLFRFNRERQAIIDEVIDRVTRQTIQAAWDQPNARLDNLLNEAAYIELSLAAGDSTARTNQRTAFWRDVVRTIARSSEEENAELIRRVVSDYAYETAGHFRAGVQKVAVDVIPRGLSLLMGALRGRGVPSLDALSERIVVEGELARIQRLSELGTLVFATTHASRLDASFMGLAMHLAGLPPLVHGADSTLFNNPMTSFFMANLGAYKVDRLMKHTLYKRVLKTYSQVLIERGYHSFFFPTGGRSRSNQLDEGLKLGLLGTALDAWTHNVTHGSDKPVFIVPVTMNYNLVLEAETLISDFLSTPSRRQSIIAEDEFSDPRRVASYLTSALESPDFLTVRLCTPMDPFGNEVNQDGFSVDRRGRVVDPKRYLDREGRPVEDKVRARAYTRGLGRELLGAWRRNNVVFPLHIVSLALFEHVCRQHPSWDVERILWFAKGDVVSRTIAEGETERVIRQVRRDAAEGRLRLSTSAEKLSAPEMVDRALALFRAYHSEPIVEEEGRELRLADLRLLNFYGNRLRGYGLERRLNASPGGY